jgi:hypothetical protein
MDRFYIRVKFKNKLMRPLLSKTTYMYGLQCPKRLFLNKFHKDLANPEDEVTQSIFQTGTDVGELAQQLFPNGLNAQGDEEWHSEITVKRTAELLLTHDVIYEAAFIYNEVICAVDILVKKGNKFYAYEVKSTTKVKPQHIEDAALQYYVLKNCGLKIADFSIVHFDTSYVKIGAINIPELFESTSVFENINEKQKAIKKNIEAMKLLLLQNEMPSVEMGEQCNTPYDCNFSNYCSSLLPSVEILDVILDNTITVENDSWNDFVSEIQYPIYYFDFETVMYAVPVFDYSRPYQQIPFQYSLHVQNEPGEIPSHFEYLGNGKDDPRESLIIQLIEELGIFGSIIVWNVSFEKGVLKKLAIDFPQYAFEINAIIERLVDLMPPFRPNRTVYSEAFEGRWSIKKVLPIVVPELSYGDLNIQEGGTASFMYGKMDCLSKKEKVQLRKDLLDYCCLDTLAMVKIFDNINAMI